MKKFISLILALVLSLSLVACGSESTPDPARTVDAVLSTLFHDDTTAMGDLFGYSSRDAILDDWFDGDDPRDLLLDEFVKAFAEEALLEDDSVITNLGIAFMDAFARIPYTCTTDSIDEDAGIAVVSITITPFPEDAFEDGLSSYVYSNYLDELTSSDDTSELYNIIFKAMTEYVNQLQPTGTPTTLQLSCELVEDTINGKTRSCWFPTDSESFGEEFAAAAFNFNY